MNNQTEISFLCCCFRLLHLEKLLLGFLGHKVKLFCICEKSEYIFKHTNTFEANLTKASKYNFQQVLHCKPIGLLVFLQSFSQLSLHFPHLLFVSLKLIPFFFFFPCCNFHLVSTFLLSFHTFSLSEAFHSPACNQQYARISEREVLWPWQICRKTVNECSENI